MVWNLSKNTVYINMGETVFFVTVIVIGIFSVGYVLGKSDERRK